MGSGLHVHRAEAGEGGRRGGDFEKGGHKPLNDDDNGFVQAYGTTCARSHTTPTRRRPTGLSLPTATVTTFTNPRRKKRRTHIFLLLLPAGHETLAAETTTRSRQTKRAQPQQQRCNPNSGGVNCRHNVVIYLVDTLHKKCVCNLIQMRCSLDQ